MPKKISCIRILTNLNTDMDTGYEILKISGYSFRMGTYKVSGYCIRIQIYPDTTKLIIAF